MGDIRTAGWYADPIMPSRLRYFDGTAWTDDVRPTDDLGSHDKAEPPSPSSLQPQLMTPAASAGDSLSAGAGPSGWAVLGWIAAGLASFLLAVGVGFTVTNLLVGTQDSAASSQDQGLADPAGASLADMPSPAPQTAEPTVSESAPEPTPDSEVDDPVSPRVIVERETGTTDYYDVSWDQVTVSGLDSASEKRINAILDEFTGARGREYLQADVPIDQTDYWVPGFYESSIEQVSCQEPFLCLVQRGGSMPAGGFSGHYFAETLVVDYEEAKKLDIRDFVAEDQLQTLVTKTEQALAVTDEYGDGMPLSLQADYGQFQNVIPQREGLLIYFSEQEIGPMPVEVFVYWELPERM